MRYIIDIPYKNKCFCKDIGLRLNDIKNISMLMLCLNKTGRKIIFYFECEEQYINDINEIQKNMINIFTLYSGKDFWKSVHLKEWVVYTVIEGMKKYNDYMIQKFLDKI